MSLWSIDDTWLSGSAEPALEPDLAIVDPHHHLWDHSPVMADYLMEDLWADTGSGHRVERTVFVECGWAYRQDGPEHLRSAGESTRVTAEAARAIEVGGAVEARRARIAGVVAAADLRLGARTSELLDEHRNEAGSLLKGVRYRAAHNPEGGSRDRVASLLSDDGVIEGAQAVARAGLVLDIFIHSHQLSALVALAQSVPDVVIVLDHLATPLNVGGHALRQDEILAAWRAAMAEVATCRNVTVKLGGIAMDRYVGPTPSTVPGAAPTSDDLVRRWGEDVRRIIDLFGPERCMFESNFPVDKTGSSYVNLWNAFKKMSQGYSETERVALFSQTAASVYRLD